MVFSTRRIIFSVGAAVALIAHGSLASPQQAGMSETLGSPRSPTEPPAISAGRLDLVTRAFDIASRIPAEPHLKDRSRCQEAVIATCLELGQPDLANRLAGRIDNWRRGSVYADLAAHYAERGMVAEAERSLALAASVVESAEDWRKDRVKEKIARSFALLEHARAEGQGKESGAAETAKAPLTLEEVERRLAEVQPIAEKGNFDQIRAALFACAALHDEVFAERSSREACQRAIEAAWGRLPIAVRLDVLAALIENALRHEDKSAAGGILTRAEALIESSSWLPEDRIPAVARFARLRHRAGGAEAAATAVRDALAFFRRERERMVNIDRADALRPLAEATKEILGTEAALEVYRLAIDEGAVNPNARPRAEDLALALASFARVGIEPDEALAAKVTQIDEGLVAPW